MSAARAATAAAIRFLLESRDPTGWWRDWETQAGISDEWVTAYTAAALARTGDSAAVAAAGQAFKVLCARRPHCDGWAFNGRVPADADSTLWVCRLAQALEAGERVAPAIDFLKRCLQSDGGMATYATASSVRRSMHLPARASMQGWLAPHACVTAAAAALPQFGTMPEIRAYLRREQHPEGSWHGYWWPEREYATALAVEALRVYGGPADRPAIESAAAWAKAQGSRASAFELACRIRILRGAGTAGHDGMIQELAQIQSQDGSWPSSARIRIPPPDCLDPDPIWNWREDRKDIYGLRSDQARIFTTATVLAALQP